MSTAQAIRTAPRAVTGLAVAAVGGWLLVNTATYRDGEAWSAAHIVQSLLGGTYHASGSSTFFVGVGGRHAIGLNITPACSTAAIAGAVLIVTGLLVALTRVQPVRAASGALAAVALVATVNVARLVMLSWSARNWGVSGWFEWLHVYGGSLVTILAVVAACGVYLRCIRRGRPSPRHRASS